MLLQFKFVTSETKASFVSRTNVLLVGTLILIEDACSVRIAEVQNPSHMTVKEGGVKARLAGWHV